MTTRPLHSTDKAGNPCTFYYEQDPDNEGDEHFFRVHKEPNPTPELMARDRWFDLKLSPVDGDEDSLKIDWIGQESTQRKAHYSAKGIPEALLCKAARLLGKKVASSDPEKDPWRSPDGQKMWERFVRQGKARWDPEKKRFFFIDGMMVRRESGSQRDDGRRFVCSY